MSQQSMKNPPKSDAANKPAVGQKRKSNQAAEGSTVPQKGDKRAKLDASGLGVSESASSANN